jgi:secreted Zn-dependent insulinase-like peptidase
MTNNKQQTAIQELINELISRRENIIKNSSSMSQDMLEGGVMAFESAIDLAQSLLEMDREQMIKFARYVLYEAKPTWDGVTTELTVDEYYNKTYGSFSKNR